MPEETLDIAVVDDDQTLRRVLGNELEDMGHRVSCLADVDELLEHLDRQQPDVILMDVRMPGTSGIEGLAQLRKRGCPSEVIMMTGYGSIDDAVDSMQAGAFHYLTKPYRLKELEALLERAGAKRRLEDRHNALLEHLKGDQPPLVVGDSTRMAEALDIARKAAPTDAPVLIEGETGTGKEVFARFIHHQSHLSEGPFVVINCGALPESTLQSELFGHEKGSFTGAGKRHRGLLEVADGGTLFLDEVGEITPPIQVQLLRFLQFGEIRRLGGNEVIMVKVRLIAATNRHLQEEVEAGRFREDLFYRLNTIFLQLPPLRERRGDIPTFVERTLEQQAARGRPRKQLTDEAMQLLREYSWPGNVRELKNIVARLEILSDETEIAADEVRRYFQGLHRPSPLLPGEPVTIRELEKQHIVKTLERLDNDKPAAADVLGISLKTLYNRLNSY